jgi:hypothetical protein
MIGSGSELIGRRECIGVSTRRNIYGNDRSLS